MLVVCDGVCVANMVRKKIARVALAGPNFKFAIRSFERGDAGY